MRSHRRLAFLLTCTGLLAQQQPVLRTNVHVVEVTIVANDAKGRRPADLRPTDFRVWDNGKEQAVASLELLNSRAGPGATALPPGTYSNRFGADKQPQVLSMILLDGLNTHLRQQQRMIPQVVRILSQIGPEERVAVFTLGTTLRTFHAFTSDRASLMAKLARYAGENSILTVGEDLDDLFDDSAASSPFRSMASSLVVGLTLNALEQLASHVKGAPGRKNLLWVSAAFPMQIGMPNLEEFFKVQPKGAPFSLLQNFEKEVNRTVRALNAANVAVYPIDARGLSTNPRAEINQGTMITMAEQTGGEAFYNRNDIDRSVRLALDDSRETYLLTYAPKDLLLDGSSHNIKVASTRPGLQLRYRRGYYAPEAEPAAIAGAAGHLERALSSPLNVSDIGIRASLNPAGGPAGELGIVVYVDPADLDLVLNSANWTGALRIEVIQTSAAGETFGGTRQAATLALSPEAYQRALKGGLRFDLRMKREPKASALRIGVVDERGGRAGSLSVPLPAVGQALPPAQNF
jgi:VWFA-related protein